MALNLEEIKVAIAALSERVAHLEAERDRPAPAAQITSAEQPTSATQSVPALDEEQFWALHGLQERLVDHASTADGAVMIVGSVKLPDGGPVAWQQSAGSDGMLETDWSDHAAAFNALGHPARLELLRHILNGVHATADLAEIASLGTTGQLHHHLRQLVSAGWVRQAGRGTYEVPAARVVPLLACLTGVQR